MHWAVAIWSCLFDRLKMGQGRHSWLFELIAERYTFKSLFLSISMAKSLVAFKLQSRLHMKVRSSPGRRHLWRRFKWAGIVPSRPDTCNDTSLYIEHGLYRASQIFLYISVERGSGLRKLFCAWFGTQEIDADASPPFALDISSIVLTRMIQKYHHVANTEQAHSL